MVVVSTNFMETLGRGTASVLWGWYLVLLEARAGWVLQGELYHITKINASLLQQDVSLTMWTGSPSLSYPRITISCRLIPLPLPIFQPCPLMRGSFELDCFLYAVWALHHSYLRFCFPWGLALAVFCTNTTASKESHMDSINPHVDFLSLMHMPQLYGVGLLEDTVHAHGICTLTSSCCVPHQSYMLGEHMVAAC